jgi:hypothetical protein
MDISKAGRNQVSPSLNRDRRGLRNIFRMASKSKSMIKSKRSSEAPVTAPVLDPVSYPSARFLLVIVLLLLLANPFFSPSWPAKLTEAQSANAETGHLHPDCARAPFAGTGLEFLNDAVVQLNEFDLARLEAEA